MAAAHRAIPTGNLIGTDGKIGGAGSLGLPASAVQVASPDTGANAALRIAVAHEAPLNVEWPEYGASPTAADNTAAIQAAINALPTRTYNGGTVAHGQIFFPRPGYKCSGQLNLDGTTGAVLTGIGDNTDPFYYSSTSSAASLIYTGSGTAPFISARSSQGLVAEKLSIVYTNSGFTGNLIDFSHAPSGPLTNWDAVNMVVRDSFIGGFSVNTARCLISLKQALGARVENCVFNHAAQAVRLREEDPVAHTVAYSNAHTFTDCWFGGDMLAGIVNAGAGLRVVRAVVENTSQPSSRIVNLYTDDLDASATVPDSYALTFEDCGWYDTPAGLQVVMLNFGIANYHGVEVVGGVFAGHTVTGDAFMRFARSATGIKVQGVIIENLTNGIDLGVQSTSNTHKGVLIAGSDLNFNGSVTNPIMNRNGHVGVRILGVNPVTQEHTGFGQLRSESSTQPTLAASTNVGTTGTVGFLDTGATDAAGLIRLSPGGTGIAAGTQLTLTYAQPYPLSPALSGQIPKVTITPANALAAGLNAYVDRTGSDRTKFTLGTVTAPVAGNQYEWHYHVIQ